MAESSQEPMANSPTSGCSLKKSPSYREAQELLSRHIKRQKLLRKYSGQSNVSPSDVRKEAEKILNEFLKRQLKRELQNSPLLSQKYQKVVVEDEYERTQHLDDETLLKGENLSGDEIPVAGAYASVDAIDNIPFMDGVEDNEMGTDGRSRSLPGAIQFSVKSDNVIPKSQSLSPQTLITGDKPASPRKRSSAQLDSHSLSSHSKSPSPRPQGRGQEIKSPEDHPTEPVKTRRRFRSGSISSSDTDTERVISPERKKKTVFKRLQERFARAVSKDREKMELDGGRESPDDVKKKKKKRKARSKKRDDKHNGTEILREKHTHKEGHIEQHHDGENKDILLRTDETWESTDITDFEKSQSRHIDTHRKVKESTDMSGSSEKGILGALRRITSRKGKNKSSIKESKSAIIQDKSGKSTANYDRVLSLPSGSPDLNLHQSEDIVQMGGGRHRIATTAVTSPEPKTNGQAVGLPKMGPVHEKTRSEPVQPTVPMVPNDYGPSGHTIPHGFHFRENTGDGEVKIPENRSFNIDYSVDEKERVIRTSDGEVVIETDKQRSLRPPSDLEIDGAGASVSRGRSPRRTTQESDLDDDVDDLRIAKVAQRIAEMGDSYMTESSQVGSPVSNPDERDGEGLNELERKLRDCFRDFGDSINQKLTMSVEPKEAAVNIAKQVTYSRFKDTVNDIVGDSVGWQQLAMLFYVTKKATQLAGAGGAVAAQLKENCLQYVEDHFANWILNQGGWDSVLESDETDFDIDL